MAKSNTYSVPYRRKREGKTNYPIRMKLLLGRKPRLVVRKSSKHFLLQIIDFTPKGDAVLAKAHSQELAKYGWKGATSGTSAAFLTGLLLSKRFSKECNLDIGLASSVKGSTLYAAVAGCIEGGIKVNCSKEVIPSKDRIRGEHTAKYAQEIKSNQTLYQKQFGRLIKNGLMPEKLPEHFDTVKAKVNNG